MDADWSHDPRYLPTLIDRASTDADLVLGSRWVAGGGTRNWGLGRRLISRAARSTRARSSGFRSATSPEGFKCFRAEVLRAIDLPTVESTGYGFQIELTYRAIKKGFRVVEVPIVFEDRRVGQSKMSRAIVLEALAMVWKIR
jgi:dolichol-phosphate mannosyltransferase